jgi:hypothetical protein
MMTMLTGLGFGMAASQSSLLSVAAIVALMGISGGLTVVWWSLRNYWPGVRVLRYGAVADATILAVEENDVLWFEDREGLPTPLPVPSGRWMDYEKAFPQIEQWMNTALSQSAATCDPSGQPARAATAKRWFGHSTPASRGVEPVVTCRFRFRSAEGREITTQAKLHLRSRIAAQAARPQDIAIYDPARPAVALLAGGFSPALSISDERIGQRDAKDT